MKKIYTYFSMLIILLATACQQDDLTTTSAALQPGEYRFSVTIPEPVVATRALGNQPQNVTSMPMNVLVFDEYGFFIARQVATVESFDDDSQTGTYTVSLPKNNGKTILHFVLGDVTYDTYAPTDTEVSIFSALTVSGGTDAYWARTEIEDGISDNTEELPAVSLVRNFAKIIVTSNVTGDTSFELLGFAIVNETTAGTVAPYTGSGFATFEGLSGAEDVYATFRSQNNNFGGNSAGSVDDTAPVDEDFTTDAKYVYERNQDDASNPAYILVKATYGGETCYYKLDIVRYDASTWLTSYLNLYRNFAYNVKISSVTGAGYSTIEAAMNAVASNNISASVEVSQVNSIQDGLGNSLTVDDVDIMITTTGSYTLNYEYIHQGTTQNGEGYVQVVYDQNTSAVQSVTCNYDGTITITPVSPLPDVMQTQEFVVTTLSGLSRRVTVNVRKPFNFDAVDCDDLVERVIGSELTLVVRLPENMPTSVFPLTLDIEPAKKSIYPDVTKNRIPVETEGSPYSFQYQATVTYDEYRQNRACFFHFKTNMSESATTITVTNSHFEATAEYPNQCSFENTDNERTGFGTVTLNGAEGTYTFNTYYTSGQFVTLAFDLPCGNADHADGSINPVEIFADYFDLENAQTTTGTFTLRSDGECIFYVANDPTQRQEITFTVTQDFASETVQLSARDHKTTTIDYTTPALTLTVYYQSTQTGPGGTGSTSTSAVPNNTEISIYQDASYTELVTTKTANSSGQITMDTFVGYSGTDTIYFSCQIRSGSGGGGGGNYTTYRGNMTVEQLVTNGAITLTPSY